MKPSSGMLICIPTLFTPIGSIAQVAGVSGDPPRYLSVHEGWHTLLQQQACQRG